jgi:salicylate hydroxylase
MHPAAMAIEDAEVLGNLFSRLHHKSEISRLLDAYEELRIQRCTEVQKYEPRKVRMLTMLDGPDREARDERLRASCVVDAWAHMDEKMFKQVWGEELGYFTYDAAEQVDDWWTKWFVLSFSASRELLDLTNVRLFSGVHSCLPIRENEEALIPCQ